MAQRLEESSISEKISNKATDTNNTTQTDKTPNGSCAQIHQDEKTIEKSEQKNFKIIKNKIFVENLEYNVHENLLRKFISKFGEVKKCKIIRDSYTNKSRGFGYVEFVNDAEAAKLFTVKKQDLILNSREIKINYFREKPTKSRSSKPTSFFCTSSSSSNKLQSNNIPAASENEKQADLSQTSERDNEYSSEFNFNDLPYNVISNIFSNLCLRDLCIAEQVCKRWYNMAHITWSTKKKLMLNRDKVFGSYEKKANNPYGFQSKPVFDCFGFKSLLRKKIGVNITHLDLTEYAQHLGYQCLPIITDECPNLTHLSLSKMSMSNFQFTSLIKRCTQIKDLNVSYCSQLTDASLAKLFQYCKSLEKLDMTFCHLVTGRCFEKSTPKLKHLILDQCENITNDNLQLLILKNPNMTSLSLKRSNKYSHQTLLCIINNMSRLENLNLADMGIDSLKDANYDDIRFQNMTSLTSLDLSNSNGDNDIIASLLKNSLSLKRLNLNYCYKITDDLFTKTTINCPLEELNLNFIKQITDATLASLSQLSGTLKVVKLKGCIKVTQEAISKMMEQLTKLCSLDVRSNHVMDNSILDTALSLENRKIEIFCNDTSIDTFKFVYKYPETTKVLLDRNYYKFKYKNLTFESSFFEANKFRKNSDQVKIWEEDGLFYIGSPLGTEDSNEYIYNIDEEYDEEDEWNGYNDGNDDDFFSDEEQEMFNELG